MTDSTQQRLTGQTVELLQAMIRNECVNDGSPESGHEVRTADVLQTFLEGSSATIDRFEAAPGRTSLVARIEGSDPTAPKLCLMGHTDVVPADASGWDHDPFGGEIINDEVWGRGAVDMLNLTSSMAVAFNHLAHSNFRPKGDLIYFAVADEESGSKYGAEWMAQNHRDIIQCDYVLTESGGLHGDNSGSPSVNITAGEKGIAWRTLTVKGTPGHGSRPYRSDNALVKAAAVISRIADYKPQAAFHDLWWPFLDTLNLDDDLMVALRDPTQVDDMLAKLPNAGTASLLHACCHTTFSVNEARGQMKTNIIPGSIELGVDIRTLPGETADDVREHLRIALGDLADDVEIGEIMTHPSSLSQANTPLWDSLHRAIAKPFPSAALVPRFTTGFTDARVFRDLGAVAYGAGLFSPELNAADYGSRFHGHNERIDIESLRLTTQLWLDVVTDLLA